MELHLFADFFGDVFEVVDVFGGDDDVVDVCSVSGEDFFFESADLEHFAAQGHFAGHGEILSDGSLCESADHAGGEGNAGAGAVFGDSTFGDVDVDICVLVEVVGHLEGIAAGADVAQGGFGAFLHDFAELAGEHEVSLAFHDSDFGGEDFAADFCPCETCGDSDFGGFGLFDVFVFCGAEDGAEALGSDALTFGGLGGFGGAGGYKLFGDAAADCGDFAFEITDAGFAGVICDEHLEGAAGELDFAVF